MTPQDLRAAGEALYGAAWQMELSRALNVGGRTVRGWLAGERRMPPGLRADMVLIMRQRGAALTAMADQWADTIGSGQS